MQPTQVSRQFSQSVCSNRAWIMATRFDAPDPVRAVPPGALGYPQVTQVTFTELGLAEPLLRALLAEDYTTPTPNQIKANPARREGRDLLGIAQTRTGQTAAVALPNQQGLAAHGPKAAPK
jgi:hypothetical protein